MSVVPIRKDVNFDNVVKFRPKGKEIKLRKDGLPKETPCNSKKGVPHEVFPFRKDEDINAVIKYFDDMSKNTRKAFDKKNYARYKMLFIIGINTALRCGDIISLKWCEIFDGNGEFIDWSRRQEEKTEKYRNLVFNTAIKKAIREYCAEFEPNPNPNKYIFESRQGDSKRQKGQSPYISVQTVNKVIQKAAKVCDIQYKVGSHSMRKTFGYKFIERHPRDIRALAKLQEMLNHSDQSLTLRYIGLSDDETKKYCENLNLGIECFD